MPNFTPLPSSSIEAVQFSGKSSQFSPIYRWLKPGAGPYVEPAMQTHDERKMHINDDHGSVLTISPGDWIVKNKFGPPAVYSDKDFKRLFTHDHHEYEEPTRAELEAFINRAGFSYGWSELESWARRIAERAVVEQKSRQTVSDELGKGALISKYYDLAGISEDIKHGGLKAFDQTCLDTLRRVMAELWDIAGNTETESAAAKLQSQRAERDRES